MADSFDPTGEGDDIDGPSSERLNPFDIEQLLHSGSGLGCGRYTQDSPIMPDVWRRFMTSSSGRLDLLLTPHFGTPATLLADVIRARLRSAGVALSRVRLAANDSYVVGRFTLEELLILLPLVRGWHERLSLWTNPADAAPRMEELFTRGPGRLTRTQATLYWFAQAVGLLLLVLEARRERLSREREARKAGGGEANTADPSPRQGGPTDPRAEQAKDLPQLSYLQIAEAFHDAISRVPLPPPEVGRQTMPVALARVSTNRAATQATMRSTLTVKADAARLLFNIKTDQLVWGVVDSGIDADHPAFAASASSSGVAGSPGTTTKRSRIVARYDFCKLRTLLTEDGRGALAPEGRGTRTAPLRFGRQARELAAKWRKIRSQVRSGTVLDWPRLEPFLRYTATPADPHGTHVAGILGGRFVPDDASAPDDPEFSGMCPDIQIYDLRVFDDEGTSDEFTILCALQFVRFLNTQGAQPVVHGVNLSFSLRHDVTAFACGATPVCEECDRLVSTGTVVVAAAGNAGFDKSSERYFDVSLTDPGNAESVITVGSTHRSSPHSYGISYFSSRGPTADGRAKPDLVAPGEKIISACPVGDAGGATLSQDGTSMAAPHVSGAAALLMARNPELIGKPVRIKQVLCKTATDLGRTRDFQGCGLLDVLRALQSV